ncbi:MAG: DUF2062 domain-containing protein [Acidobacteria bacterium]|nr:DUF2062 domain-containing protein [Acidobacteriota bacterium]
MSSSPDPHIPPEKPLAKEPKVGAGGVIAKLRARIRETLGQSSSPEVVAASFALGVAIAFTPLFGFHTWMALGLAFLLRLNKLDVLLGTLVVNPLTFAPVSAVAIPLGRMILRAEREALAQLPWKDLMKLEFWRTAGPSVRAVSLQWAVGMFALSFLAGILTYVIVLALVRRMRASRPRPAITGPAGPPPAAP